MITFVFAMNGPRLGEEETSSFSEYAQWRVLHERNGRLLVDGIGELPNLQIVLGGLQQMGRNPVAIGAWNEDGSAVEGFTLNEAEWLTVAPDDWDVTDPENPVAVRPTAWKDIHQWAGWGEKQL